MASIVWNSEDIPDLNGKVAIVTGSNRGIGYHVLEQLALHRAKVYMATRSESTALSSIEQIYKHHPQIEKGKIVFLHLDLSDLANVAKAAQTISEKENRLDILINNGGNAFDKFELLDSGYETSMVVNYLGHFLLTTNLLPLLKATAAKPNSDVRIITSGSEAHPLAPLVIQFDKLEDFKYPGFVGDFNGLRNKFVRYGLSKAANILFASELQRHLDAAKLDILSMSVCAGTVATQGARDVLPWILRPFHRFIATVPEKGAESALFLATASEAREHPANYKGLFIGPKHVQESTSAFAQDAQRAERLWKITREALKDYLTSDL